MANAAEGLSRSERIRHRPEFERVYEHGVRLSGRFMTVFVIATDQPQTRLGVAATRKLGSAVVRNRAKRLARELFRRRKLSGNLDIVIVPRPDMLHAPFASLDSDYTSLLAERNKPGRGRSGRPSQHRGSSRPRVSPRV